MTRPQFRSTASFTRRTRTTTVVERATFVLFSIGGKRFAAPVEVVDRVERPTAAMFAAHDGCRAPETGLFLDIAAPLGVALGTGEATSRRVLVVTLPHGACRIPVDAVHEVAAIDAALVLPLDRDDPSHESAELRARFERQEAWVYVVDLVRLLSPRTDVRR